MFRVAGGVFGPGVLPEPPPATSELASVSAVTRGKTCYSEGNNLRLQDITAAILAHQRRQPEIQFCSSAECSDTGRGSDAYPTPNELSL